MSGFFSVEQKREIEFYENHEKETGGKNNMCVNFIIAYWWYMYKYVKKNISKYKCFVICTIFTFQNYEEWETVHCKQHVLLYLRIQNSL